MFFAHRFEFQVACLFVCFFLCCPLVNVCFFIRQTKSRGEDGPPFCDRLAEANERDFIFLH